jgi:Tol biopolymer transport system component
LVVLLATGTQAQTTQRVSVDSSGAQGNALSSDAEISKDGRYVIFDSDSSNLVPGDTNLVRDVFRFDRLTGVVIRVSVDSNGVEGDALSSIDGPSLSADGQFVAFYSSASNLVAGDTNLQRDVFVHDCVTGATERVSVSSGGAQGNALSSGPVMSDDGRYVAFYSDASNLIGSDTNAVRDVFLRDRQAGVTTRVSVSFGGVQGDALSSGPSISGTGRYVAFYSSATNLVNGDTNGMRDVFVRDTTGNTTIRVSVSTANVQGDKLSSGESISDDGRYVVFYSDATNLVSGDTNAVRDVFLRDRTAGTTTRISLTTGGAQGNARSEDPRISADGAFIVYASDATNLVSGDTNAVRDVFLRDIAVHTTTRASVSSSGVQGNDLSSAPSCSSDGRFIVFGSYASNLVSGDTNATEDVYLRDRICPPPISYCTGGTTTSGCVAVMSSWGAPSATAGLGFVLSATNVEGQKSGLVFYGVSGQLAAPWGVGGTSYLCVKTPTQRTPAQNSNGTASACDGVLSVDWNAYVASHPNALGVPFSVGAVVEAQAWFRDPAAVKTTNLSNGLEFIVCP